MARRDDLLKQIEDLLKKKESRRDSSVRTREEQQKLDEAEIKNLREQVKEIDAKATAQKRYADEVKKVNDKEVSFTKKLLENKNSINLTVAKGFNLYSSAAKDQIVTAIKGDNVTLEQRKALLKLGDFALQNQDAFIQGLDTGLDKEQIKESFTENEITLLEEKLGLLDDVLDVMDENSRRAGKFGSAIEGANSILDSVKGAFGITAGLVAFVTSQIIEFATNVQTIKKDLGLSLATTTRLAGQAQSLGFFAKVFGMNTEDVLTIQKEILSTLGDTSKVTSGLVTEFIKLQGIFGVSASAAGKLIPILDAIGAAGERSAVAQIKSLAALAQQAGVAPGQVIEDIASQSEFFAQFAKDGGKNLFNAALQARKLGLEFSALETASNALLDFESSIEKQLEASLLLGRQINLDRARQLALAGDQEGVLQEIRAAVGGEAEFNRLNVLQRRALAESVGLQVEQIARLSRGQQATVTGAAVRGDNTGAQQVDELRSINRGINRLNRTME